MNDIKYAFKTYPIDDGCSSWAVVSLVLKGCYAIGTSVNEAINNFAEAEKNYIAESLVNNIELPDLPPVLWDENANSDLVPCGQFDYLRQHATVNHMSEEEQAEYFSRENEEQRAALTDKRIEELEELTKIVNNEVTLNLIYRAIKTQIKYDHVNEVFYGKLLDIDKCVNFYGNTLEEAEESFHTAVDKYYDAA